MDTCSKGGKQHFIFFKKVQKFASTFGDASILERAVKHGS